MTQQSATFSPSQFELRGYTNPYLTSTQKSAVSLTETRVSGELDFVAQMLGWSGANYWTNLATTVNEKRQLLGGTYGVYNSFIVAKVREIRNWNNILVIEDVPQIKPGLTLYSEYILVGTDKYTIQSATRVDGLLEISIGTLSESFYTQVSNNVPILISIPVERPAPFYRPSVGVSGDASFCCAASGTTLTLYPSYDTTKKFPYLFPTLFAGSVYYFDQPLYLSYTSSLALDVLPEYDSERALWYLVIPAELSSTQVGVSAFLVWPYADSTTSNPASLSITVKSWQDPSDWGTQSVLENYRGAWNNKGGVLPYNLVFDSLSIHGFDEENSVYMAPFSRTLSFDDLVTRVYSQRVSTSQQPPGTPKEGDLWWNSFTGVLSCWVPSSDNCSAWVEIDYRIEPLVFPYGDVVFADVTAFNAASSTIPLASTVTILDITGLSLTENVLGVQGILNSPGTLTMVRESLSTPYWVPLEFLYLNEPDFFADALLLPYKVPVTIADGSGVSPSGTNYTVENLEQQITEDYVVRLTKYYTNTTWLLSPDSILEYVANSSLFTSPVDGEMWWDYAVPTPELRSACVYYGSTWVQVNSIGPSATPAPSLDLSVLNFYADGTLLSPGVGFSTKDYSIVYTSNTLTGTYTFSYSPVTLKGRTQFPKITISDNLTTTYQSDVSALVFGGAIQKMSPNVLDSETPLRLWKTQDLQVAETVAHLLENTYINPLVADLNTGPGLENWERYFIRLPLDYGRQEAVWQKVALTCQDFGYWGTTIYPEKMRCPPEDDTPAIYEELFLYDQPIPDYTYVYCEPYLYSNLAYFDISEVGDYRNAGVFPASDVEFDEFSEAFLSDYDALHSRQADFSGTPGNGFGNWKGEYVNVNPCVPLTGFLTTDLHSGGVQPVAPPVWDASIYKFAPTCENDEESFSVDSNHYKVGYAYFVADASAAEDGFFDLTQEAAWRSPEVESRSLYLLPR